MLRVKETLTDCLLFVCRRHKVAQVAPLDEIDSLLKHGADRSVNNLGLQCHLLGEEMLVLNIGRIYVALVVVIVEMSVRRVVTLLLQGEHQRVIKDLVSFGVLDR